MRARRIAAAFLLLLALLLAGNWYLLYRPEPPAQRLSLALLMGEEGAAEGFARALEPGAIQLPRDHGPQPQFRSEWWYFTGNLHDAAGDAFGFQLTFFRFAVTPALPPRSSSWATRDVWMAHFALTDIAAGRHAVVERFGRPGPGGAGARGEPFAVWLDDWRAQSAGAEFLPLHLAARDAGAGLALELELGPGRPPVFHGQAGLSQKGPEPGNASYYYSYTRLPASGRLQLGNRTAEVSGEAWLDREWGTSALGAGTAGWDWFGLQLDDGRELMLYGLRHEDGGWLPQSAGTLLEADGGVLHLAAGDFRIEPLRYWRSPGSGVSYPVEWRLRAPAAGIDLIVEAAVDDQEQDLAVRYWEGSVRVLDSDRRPAGRGYMELVGYRN